MKAQPIVPWTLPRIAQAFGAWLMEEDHHVQLVAIKIAEAKEDAPPPMPLIMG